MTYHPETNPTELPRIETIEDLDKLPWGGNAWWDLPIMVHVNKQIVADEMKPMALRIAVCARAGYLMTGMTEPELTETEFKECLAAGYFTYG